MSKLKMKSLAAAQSITATDILPAQRLNKTPFLGGSGGSAILALQAAVGGAGVIAVQGNDSVGPDEPAEDDAGWSTIVTLNAAAPLRQEIELPAWIRLNITTLGTGTITVNLESDIG